MVDEIIFPLVTSTLRRSNAFPISFNMVGMQQILQKALCALMSQNENDSNLQSVQ
jgi:hypothetical protein